MPVSDVPAIKRERCCWRTKMESAGCVTSDRGRTVHFAEGTCLAPTYSCADPSRFLLTSEDGKHHCIEF